MTKQAIVLVHGVGPAKTGSTIKSLLTGQKNRTEICEFGELQLGQHSYTKGELADGLQLFESNWSELRPLQTSGPWILLEALVLVFSMLKASSIKKFAGEDNSHSILGYAYFSVFIWGYFWCLNAPIVAMFLVLGSPLSALAWICTLIFISTLLARYDRAFYSGLAWSVGLLILFSLFFWADLSPMQLVRLTSTSYFYVQLVTNIVFVAAIVEVFWSSNDRLGQRTTVRVAFIYVPYLVASCLGSLVWAIALVPATNGGTNFNGQFGKWATLYGETLMFDLYAAERFNGILTMICGIVLLYPAIILIAMILRKNTNAARDARKSLIRCLRLIPILLVLGVMGFIWFVLLGTDNSSNDAEQIWNAYATWSTRILAFLPFLFGGLALTLKAAGDVLLYLIPQTELIRTRKVAVNRLRTLVSHLKDGGYEVIILCHSQGTIIGLDVVSMFPNKLGIWISGSPADALYYDFLGLERIEKIHVKEFRNYYRHDDPIAGPVRTKDDWHGNIAAGWGGHTNYWPIFGLDTLRCALSKMSLTDKDELNLHENPIDK